MSMPVARLSSFYTYRYPEIRYTLEGAHSNDKEEQQIRDKVKEGDAAFAKYHYSKALAIYLEAYAALYRFLYPGFPAAVLSTLPSALLALNINDLLMTATAQTAGLRASGSTETAYTLIDPPEELRKIVDEHTVEPNPVKQPAEIAYDNATKALGIGDVSRAQFLLSDAQRLNRGRDGILDARLDAHISSTLATTHVVNGNFAAAQNAFNQARQKYVRLGMPVALATINHNSGVAFSLSGDTEQARSAFTAAELFMPQSATNIDARRSVNEGRFTNGRAASIDAPVRANLLIAGTDGDWLRFAPTMEGRRSTSASRNYRMRVGNEARQVEINQNAVENLINVAYKPRMTASDLEILDYHPELQANFLVYLPHLYGFVLPMSIGDCYAGMGRNTEAIEYYLKALDYQFLNKKIEAPHVWLKAARAVVKEADQLFRKGAKDAAKEMYEKVILPDDTIPAASFLYKHQRFNQMSARVSQMAATTRAQMNFIVKGRKQEEMVADVKNGLAALDNLEIGALIVYVQSQLAKIANGLNWLGLEEEVAPIWSFDFLQATARYYAQHAVQAWREYLSYRATAEQAEMTQMEMEHAVTMASLDSTIHFAQLEVGVAQVDVAQTVETNVTKHRDNLTSARAEFDDKGWVAADVDRVQAWVSNTGRNEAAPPRHWDWGAGRVVDTQGLDIQTAMDQLAMLRNQLSHDMQLSNFDRQISEANDQITLAGKQKVVAQKQLTVAVLQSIAAVTRQLHAESALEFFKSRETNPDLWHALADRLREVAQQYLDLGIKTAFLMERAYEVENDRNLKRIRFDYTDPKVGELTAGDSLLMDIDSFTYDLLVNVKGHRNRIRHVISLADFAPKAFAQFTQSGVMEFSIPLEMMNRAYPGTYLHRIQNVEIEIEGLQVPQGITGTLTHLGVSTWRRENGEKHSRATPPETMILSGFSLRRDLSLFRSDPNRLGLFENSGTAGSWILELPLSSNDIDFTSISDVRFVLYFHCLHSAELEAKTRAQFPKSGGAGQAFSARLHAPDQFFAFGPPPDGSKSITFTLDPKVFPYNQRNLTTKEIGIQVLRLSDSGAAEPFGGLPLTVRMAGKSGAGVTEASGTLATDKGGGALSALIDKPVGDVEVEVNGPAEQLAQVGDVILLLNYRFDYR